MTSSPLDAVPSVVKRQQLVAQAMDSLEGVDEQSVEEQLARLGQVQELLAGVLNNSDVSQLRIPGAG